MNAPLAPVAALVLETKKHAEGDASEDGALFLDMDIAILGAVEIDPEGSVNVASLGDRFAGVGGFVNIAQAARRLVFCCTFRAKENAKFVRRIAHVCFHGPSALARGQQVLYVTERAVFELTSNGLRLLEVAPGFDAQRDVIDQMEFTPLT